MQILPVLKRQRRCFCAAVWQQLAVLRPGLFCVLVAQALVVVVVVVVQQLVVLAAVAVAAVAAVAVVQQLVVLTGAAVVVADWVWDLFEALALAYQGAFE
jgi:hypothetical protein